MIPMSLGNQTPVDRQPLLNVSLFSQRWDCDWASYCSCLPATPSLRFRKAPVCGLYLVPLHLCLLLTETNHSSVDPPWSHPHAPFHPVPPYRHTHTMTELRTPAASTKIRAYTVPFFAQGASLPRMLYSQRGAAHDRVPYARVVPA